MNNFYEVNIYNNNQKDIKYIVIRLVKDFNYY